MTRRIRLEIEGIVQGVGFRPFVYRLARECKLGGWVKNSSSGVVIEAEGEEDSLTSFRKKIAEETPPLAVIAAIREEDATPDGGREFTILSSVAGPAVARIAPDGDVCADCLRELFDPSDRRYRYPFINCTNCGPRYSIITGIPYDRPNTTMARFPLCPACREEYENPADRRFHAQPVACPVCGPRLSLLDAAGIAIDRAPLEAAVSFLKEGKILAIKGVGGYHLAVDACNDGAVGELRRRKHRDEKPFALMTPGLEELRSLVYTDGVEERLLSGPERPILLLRKRKENPVSPRISPANGYLGIMLPSAPLHHLLLRNNFIALVMTSGNLSDEPIAYRDDEALERLAGIADYFLAHDRPIHTRLDDSVIRVFLGNPLFLRRSRGYVPRGVQLPAHQPGILAVGAELKSAICLTRGDTAFLSQHIGDLKNAATLRSLEELVSHMEQTMEIKPLVVAHDLHPDYLSTTYAERLEGVPKIAVQHHHAHMASCMAENRLEGEVIGVIFDGTGYGEDGTVWGGEFLTGGYSGFRRAGHLQQVPLPGGDAAVREPFRMALSWLHAAFGERLFDLNLPALSPIPEAERKLYLQMLQKGINSPPTSSCGRLFDAVAALVGLRRTVTYEGQAAIELEGLAERDTSGESYPYALVTRQGVISIDLRMMIAAIVEDLAGGRNSASIARSFHNTLAVAIAATCEKIRKQTGINRVVLSGGVFQNRLLSEESVAALEHQHFTVFTHRLVPPNDGGISLGQAIIAGRSCVCA